MYILIVDSHPLITKGMVNILSNDYNTEELHEANNYLEARKLLQNHKIQILITGLNLSYENGLDLITYAKKNYSSIKVIALSTTDNIYDFMKAKEIGVDGYLLKSAKIEDFEYALKVIQRGDHFYSNQLLEKSIHSTEPKELSELTEREKEVFKLLCKGLTNYEISKNLYITEATIKKHISNILNKLHLSNRIDVIFWANNFYDNQNNIIRSKYEVQ